MNKMKPIRLVVATLAFVAVILLTGCRKGGINGDLDGMWQILTVEQLSDGTTTNVKDRQLYYCLYLHTANLTKVGGVAETANMTYDGDKLTLEFPSSSVESLKPWFIYANTVVFTIDHLTRNDLVMHSDRVKLTFRKY